VHYKNKILDHAARRLTGLDRLEPAEVAQRLRRFIKIEDERLLMAYRCGASGLVTAQNRSFVLDVAVEHSMRATSWFADDNGYLSNTKPTWAVVALGGYGRGELAPFSDLDILLLHTARHEAQLRQANERLLQVLWDAGLTIGNSFRTVRQCLSASHSDLHLQTALTSIRLLAGSQRLFDSLSQALDRERRSRSKSFVKAVLNERAERYGKFGDAVCLQEPNVKESAGGLRDLHTALWVAYAKYGAKSLPDLLVQGLISEQELRVARRAYDFLLSVRFQTHLAVGRKVDHISLDLQPGLAAGFGYSSDSRLLGSEKFMRFYYQRALDLYLFCENVLVRATEKDKRPLRWFGVRAVSLAEPFSIEDGKLHFDQDAAIFRQNPYLMFDAFALAQAANVGFSHGLLEAIRNNLGLVDKSFRHSAEAANCFLRLLRRRGRVAHTLRLMHQVGFLGRYLPEFGRVSLLIQHDLYHHYTIDEHTLKVIEALDELNNSEDSTRAHLRAVFDEIEDSALLYLSLLLHDIGKGQGPGHVARGVRIAEQICRRLRLEKTEAAKVVSMVEHHIAMAHVSQRRDLSEPQVAPDFAARMGTLDNLNMLLLLTYSDMRGVGPGVWSEWKGNLLWDLYERSRQHLAESGSAGYGLATQTALREKILAALDGHFPLSEVERHLALLPDRYLRTTTAEATGEQLRLIRQLATDAFRCRWVPQGRTITELTICAHDRHGLFADIAGTLTSQGIEILSAEIYTREDGIAIDIFKLRSAVNHHAIEERKWLPIERALRAAIKGESDVAALVEKWQTQHAPRRRHRRFNNNRHQKLAQVQCDNKAAQTATIVEVRAADEAGLAYKIASVATALGFEITYAKITTEKSDAFDVFYITDASGNRLSPEAMRELEVFTLEKLSGSKGAKALVSAQSPYRIPIREAPIP